MISNYDALQLDLFSCGPYTYRSNVGNNAEVIYRNSLSRIKISLPHLLDCSQLGWWSTTEVTEVKCWRFV